MHTRTLFPLILLVGLSVGVAQAVPIPVENFSFELPGTTKQANFESVPGWSTDTVPADSGVELDHSPTDGSWTAFLRGGAADPSIWQLTDHTIINGDVFELTVDAMSTSNATTFRMTLYYDVDGSRVVGATQDVAITGTMATFTLTFASADVLDSIGHKLGIEFANVTGDSTWAGLDNVRLDLVVEGSAGGALSPMPANKATDVPWDVVLSWKPGPWANTHDVYFGLSFEDVNSADVDNPMDVLVSAGQDANTFEPGRLMLGATYYWRVDEVNAPPASTVYKGNVWSFTVEPVSYPIDANHITATASSSAKNASPTKTIDGSGLDEDGQHSDDTTAMWVSDSKGVQPTWIQYEFDKVYMLDHVLIWNYNMMMEPAIGFGVKDVTIEYSADGVAWTALGDFEVPQATGEITYKPDAPIDLGRVAAKYVKFAIQSSWGGRAQYGLSEVQFFMVPAAAREPVPASEATGVAPEVALKWRAGRLAASHEVYLSTDEQAVIDGTAPVAVVSQASYDAVIDLAATYYWKVVEVNEAMDPAAWESDIWSFSTADSIVVDDFESYTDDEGGEIFTTWADGWQIDENGSLVGYGESPFAEQTIVHGGGQSMPLSYENTNSTMTSETTRTFDGAQDWTKAAVTTLTLYFRGVAGNATNVPLWVKVTDQSNKSAKVTFSGDAGVLAEPAWTEWDIPLSSFSGVSLARVKSITIGLGPGMGAGELFIDDIQLYPAREPVVLPPAVLVGHWKLDGNAQDSSGNANNGTLVGSPVWATAGRIGGALTLDGIDDYVNCGNGESLNITDTITLAAWVKTDDSGNSEHNPYVVKGDQSYALKHNSGNTLEFFIYDGGWYAVNSEVLTADFNGAWHHVAGTYDGVQLKLYLDGVLVNSALHTGAISSTTYDVNIGRDAQNTDRLYDGLIDDVRIYHGVLPTSEIVKLANP